MPADDSRHRRRKMRNVARIVAVAAALVLTLGVVGCGSPPSNAEVTDVVKKVGGAYDGMAAGARPFDRLMSVGQVVAVPDKADVTLQAISQNAQGWPAPDAGKQIVVLDLTLVNRSSRPGLPAPGAAATHRPGKQPVLGSGGQGV